MIVANRRRSATICEDRRRSSTIVDDRRQFFQSSTIVHERRWSSTISGDRWQRTIERSNLSETHCVKRSLPVLRKFSAAAAAASADKAMRSKVRGCKFEHLEQHITTKLTKLIPSQDSFAIRLICKSLLSNPNHKGGGVAEGGDSVDASTPVSLKHGSDRCETLPKRILDYPRQVNFWPFFLVRGDFSASKIVLQLFGTILEDLRRNGRQNQLLRQILLQIDFSWDLYSQI